MTRKNPTTAQLFPFRVPENAAAGEADVIMATSQADADVRHEVVLADYAEDREAWAAFFR